MSMNIGVYSQNSYNQYNLVYSPYTAGGDGSVIINSLFVFEGIRILCV